MLRSVTGLGLAAVLAVAAAVRLTWIALMPVPPESDFAQFVALARAIADGQWPAAAYSWRFQGPGYPLALAPLAGDLTAMRLLNVAFQLLAVACAYLIGRRLAGRRAGLVAAAIAALLPPLWAYTALIAAENLAAPLVAAAVLFALPGGSRRALVFAGLACGALLFARPAYVALPLALALPLLRRDGARRSLAAYALGVALAVVPFAGANLAGGGPAFSLAPGAFSAWLSHNERSTGTWFPAEQRDDYPFAGLALAAGDAIEADAQRLLAARFAVANVREEARRLADRHRVIWGHAQGGWYWTLDRWPSLAAGVPFGAALPNVGDALHAAVFALAAVGALRLRASAAIAPPILVVAYALLVYDALLAEDRYQTPLLPLFAALAACALVPVRPRWLALGALVAGAALIRPGLASLFVLVVVLGPAASWIRGFVTELRPHPRRARTVALVGGVALAAVLALAWSFREATLRDIAALDPGGWEPYGAAAVGLERSDVPAHLRKVSYPDAALLGFAGAPAPGSAAGMRRTLPGLEAGASYRLYLQVREAGVAGERVRVALNGREVWSSVGDGAARWRPLSLAWVADAASAEVRIDREAAPAGAPGPLAVRGLHLYPRY